MKLDVAAFTGCETPKVGQIDGLIGQGYARRTWLVSRSKEVGNTAGLTQFRRTGYECSTFARR